MRFFENLFNQLRKKKTPAEPVPNVTVAADEVPVVSTLNSNDTLSTSDPIVDFGETCSTVADPPEIDYATGTGDTDETGPLSTIATAVPTPAFLEANGVVYADTDFTFIADGDESVDSSEDDNSGPEAYSTMLAEYLGVLKEVAVKTFERLSKRFSRRFNRIVRYGVSVSTPDYVKLPEDSNIILDYLEIVAQINLSDLKYNIYLPHSGYLQVWGSFSDNGSMEYLKVIYIPRSWGTAGRPKGEAPIDTTPSFVMNCRGVYDFIGFKVDTLIPHILKTKAKVLDMYGNEFDLCEDTYLYPDEIVNECIDQQDHAVNDVVFKKYTEAVFGYTHSDSCNEPVVSTADNHEISLLTFKHPAAGSTAYTHVVAPIVSCRKLSCATEIHHVYALMDMEPKVIGSNYTTTEKSSY